MKKRLATLVLVAAVLTPALAVSSPAAGDQPSPKAVVDWSFNAQRAIVGMAGFFPGDAAVLMGIVHVAIYDAVVAVEGGARPYAIRPAVPPGASAEVATATAAHRVLIGLLPELQPDLDATYAGYVSAYPDGPARAGGIAVGEEVAAGILALRADDGTDDGVPYGQTPPGPGVFEPTAPFPPVGTHVGEIEPLTLPRADLFRLPGPPPLRSAHYARDFAEVAARGRIDSPVRSPQETAVARFWNDHGVAQWNGALHRLIDTHHLTLVQAARLLAMAHASGGDGMIACFAAKYEHRFWRPIHAIRRAGTDGNDRTAPDPTWTSLLPTPNHPEYPAAHTCHSGAVAAAITMFFGTDRVAITVDSRVTGETRHYDRLSAAIAQIIDARILGGIHFRFSGEDGATLGSRVGRFASTRFPPTSRPPHQT
ncbi:MAG: vanadium-dependent haloperoxidase [Acidimicrobiales bacterium]